MNAMETTSIDETIEQVEKLYRALIGKEPGLVQGTYAPIPAEKDPLGHVEEQMDRLASLLELRTWGPAWTPLVSVLESDNEVLVCMDLPGVDRQSVTVQLEGSVLTVSGRRPAPPSDGWRMAVNERPLGDFRRSVMVPAATTADPVAQITLGVLEVRIAKEPARPVASKTIPVS